MDADRSGKADAWTAIQGSLLFWLSRRLSAHNVPVRCGIIQSSISIPHSAASLQALKDVAYSVAVQ